LGDAVGYFEGWMVGFIEYDGTAVGLDVGDRDGRIVGADNEFDGPSWVVANAINNISSRFDMM
jgi:hypothetical protein